MIFCIQAVIFIWQITAAKSKEMADKSETDVNWFEQVIFILEFTGRLLSCLTSTPSAILTLQIFRINEIHDSANKSELIKIKLWGRLSSFLRCFQKI